MNQRVAFAVLKGGALHFKLCLASALAEQVLSSAGSSARASASLSSRLPGEHLLLVFLALPSIVAKAESTAMN